MRAIDALSEHGHSRPTRDALELAAEHVRIACVLLEAVATASEAHTDDATTRELDEHCLTQRVRSAAPLTPIRTDTTRYSPKEHTMTAAQRAPEENHQPPPYLAGDRVQILYMSERGAILADAHVTAVFRRSCLRRQRRHVRLPSQLPPRTRNRRRTDHRPPPPSPHRRRPHQGERVNP